MGAISSYTFYLYRIMKKYIIAWCSLAKHGIQFSFANAVKNHIKVPIPYGFVGRKVEPREESKDAAYRELEEETGITQRQI